MFFRTAKRFTILMAGLIVICVGIALIVLPGPAIVVIPLGILILATEFAWAKRLFSFAKQHIVSVQSKMG